MRVVIIVWRAHRPRRSKKKLHRRHERREMTMRRSSSLVCVAVTGRRNANDPTCSTPGWTGRRSTELPRPWSRTVRALLGWRGCMANDDDDEEEEEEDVGRMVVMMMSRRCCCHCRRTTTMLMTRLTSWFEIMCEWRCVFDRSLLKASV